MSQRNWIAALAFGLTVLSGTVVAQEVTRPIERPGVVDQPDSPENAERSEDYGASKQGNFCGPSYTLNCGYRDQNATQERSPEAEAREKEDLKAQKSMARSTEEMAFWTVYMTIAAILSTVFAGLAVFFAYRSFAETRKIAVAQLRAYIGVLDPSPMDLQDSGFSVGQQAKIDFRFANHGETPARSLNYVAFMDILDHPIAHVDYDLAAPKDGIPPPNLTLPREQVFTGEASTKNPLTKSDIETIMEGGGKCLYLIGVINYRDIFDLPRKTRFCFHMDAIKKVGSGQSAITEMAWFRSPTHNDTT